MMIGHQKQRRFLEKATEDRGRSQAFLFSGPESLGKRRMAVELIKSLNCKVPREESGCERYSICWSPEKRTHPDFILLEPEQGKREIQIGQVREMIWRLSLKPVVSFFKAAIIDNAHLLNQESQNALLKTLEEPKGKALLILVSHRPQFLLPTVRSRLQEIKFFPLSRKELEEFFNQKGVHPKELGEILELAGGRPGRALALWQEPQRLTKQKEQEKAITIMLNSDLASRFSLGKDKSLVEIGESLENWLRRLREILLSGLKNNEQDLSRTIGAIRAIEKLNFLILTKKNINPRLAWEGLMLEL